MKPLIINEDSKAWLNHHVWTIRIKQKAIFFFINFSLNRVDHLVIWFFGRVYSKGRDTLIFCLISLVKFEGCILLIDASDVVLYFLKCKKFPINMQGPEKWFLMETYLLLFPLCTSETLRSFLIIIHLNFVFVFVKPM